MRRTKQLFLDVLDELNKHGVLENVILIGSWSQYFYQYVFKENVKIPAVRTLDLDFLIPNPPKVGDEINVTALLEEMGFTSSIHSESGVIKYVHPDLMVEFLIPELGKGKKESYKIPKLHISAVGLRYLNLLQSHVMKIMYHNMTIRVPEPSAYVLHKHIVSERRSNHEKRDKDRESAIEIGDYLLGIPEQKEKIKDVFVNMPKKWQKTVLTIVKKHHESMYDFLVGIK